MSLLLGIIVWIHQVHSQTIDQTPAAVSRSPGQEGTLKCTVTGTGADPRIYWYRQFPGKEPENMFYSTASKAVNSEEPVDGFTAQRPDGKTFTLSNPSLQAENSAVYLCAWSPHSGSDSGGGPTITCRRRKAAPSGGNCNCGWCPTLPHSLTFIIFPSFNSPDIYTD